MGIFTFITPKNKFIIWFFINIPI